MSDIGWAPRHQVTEWDELLEILHPPWHQQANCLGMGPTKFFPGQGEFDEHLTRGTTRAERKLTQSPIRAICGSCPVQAECLEAGLYEKYGIWGGLTGRERRTLRRQRRLAEHG